MNKIKQKLNELRENGRETELFPYLQHLFQKMGYKNVEITHGANEFGKDLVFSEYNEKLKKLQWTAVVVKNKDSTMQDFEDHGEIMRQIRLSFKHPHKDNLGKSQIISSVIVVINGKIGSQAKSVIEQTIENHLAANITMWNQQSIHQEINEYIKDDFLSDYELSFNTYRALQTEKLSKIENTKEIFHGLTIKDINEIYVSAKTNYNKYKQRKEGYLTYEDEAKKKTREEDIDEAKSILKDQKDFFIYGLPTSGKSLLLKRMGICALSEELEKPYAVFFWELSKIDLEAFDIGTEIEKQYKDFSKESFDTSKFSKTILLFDALDELRTLDNKLLLLFKVMNYKIQFALANDSIKKEKEGELSNLLESLKKDQDILSKIKLLDKINNLDAFTRVKPLQVVLTSRDQSILQENEILSKFEKIELLPFDIGQALKLVKKIIPNSNIKSNKFIRALKDSLLTNNLVRTPLALTLMAILYKEDQIDLAELPANITELYNKFTDFYLERWDSAKGIMAQYKYEEAKQILSGIAAHMHCAGMKFISESDLKDFLTNLKRSHDFKDLNNVDLFIESLKIRPGLFQYSDQEKAFYFYHLTFQEYFASIFFDDTSENLLEDNFFQEWWENILVFYCGKNPKREVFIKKIFEKKVPADIIQRYQYFVVLSKCLQANHLISKDLKKSILKSLITQYDGLYSAIIERDKSNKEGMSYFLTTLDFIMQFRDFFVSILNSKHINSDDLIQIYQEIKESGFSLVSDMTAYSLSYLLSARLSNPDFLTEFEKQAGLNVRWSRIVYIDLQILNLDKSTQHKILSKIEKRQRTNRNYIKQQFKGSAIKHLIENGGDDYVYVLPSTK